jgi:SAM-dependent methyltransferase
MSGTDESRYVPALGFQWLTPAYDVVVRTTTRERTFKTALIEQADIGPDQEVLDLACGTGTLAIWIKQRHLQANVRGIDGDPNILAIASRKAKEANVPIGFDRGLSFSLPYPDASFDRVLSSLFFHHLCWRDKQRTAQELYRVMRPGGQLHVADWGRASGALMRAAFFAIQLLDGFENTQGNVEGRLVELFREAGFSDVSEQRTFATVFGTLSLYHAVKPQSRRAGRGDGKSQRANQLRSASNRRSGEVH